MSSLEDGRYGRTPNITKWKDNSKKMIETSQKFVIISQRKGTKCSYENCLFKSLTLEFCSKKYCSNIFYHVHQNNINVVNYDGQNMDW